MVTIPFICPECGAAMEVEIVKEKVRGKDGKIYERKHRLFECPKCTSATNKRVSIKNLLGATGP